MVLALLSCPARWNGMESVGACVRWMHEHFPFARSLARLLAMQSSCSFFCSSVGPSDGLPSPPSSVLTPKMPSAAPIYDARPRPSPPLRLVSAPSVKMRPFQLLLSPPAAERGVGVARAAKQEKIEPVSNRPRARRGAVGRSGGVTKAITCRRLLWAQKRFTSLFRRRRPPLPPRPPSHFSSSTFPAR